MGISQQRQRIRHMGNTHCSALLSSILVIARPNRLANPGISRDSATTLKKAALVDNGALFEDGNDVAEMGRCWEGISHLT